jgi:uncharacterized protein
MAGLEARRREKCRDSAVRLLHREQAALEDFRRPRIKVSFERYKPSFGASHRRRNPDARMGARAMFVTPLYAGLLTLFFVLLSVRVVNLRRKGIIFGDNGDIGVIRIVRAQGNFAEYVPLALLMMGFLEVSRYSIYLLHALGIILLVARLLHGFALSFGWQVRSGRVAGAAMTFVVLLVEAVLCIYQGFRGQWVWLQ